MTKPLRLTPAFFHIMLSVVKETQHGYAIMQAVHDRTSGSVKLGPGSLYWAIKRLVDAGYLEEVVADRAERSPQRRRYYGITRNGRTVLEREVKVLADILGYAESQQLINRTGTP